MASKCFQQNRGGHNHCVIRGGVELLRFHLPDIVSSAHPVVIRVGPPGTGPVRAGTRSMPISRTSAGRTCHIINGLKDPLELHGAGVHLEMAEELAPKMLTASIESGADAGETDACVPCGTTEHQ